MIQVGYSWVVEGEGVKVEFEYELVKTDTIDGFSFEREVEEKKKSPCGHAN